MEAQAATAYISIYLSNAGAASVAVFCISGDVDGGERAAAKRYPVAGWSDCPLFWAIGAEYRDGIDRNGIITAKLLALRAA